MPEGYLLCLRVIIVLEQILIDYFNIVLYNVKYRRTLYGLFVITYINLDYFYYEVFYSVFENVFVNN